MSMSFEQVVEDIRARRFKPVYLLSGEESYFIDQITNLIMETVLDESQMAFNMSILYGKDTEVGTIDNTARRFPMGAEYNLVIVKEAQLVNKLDDLSYYANAPSESSILVIAHKYKAYDKRKKLYKAVKSSGVIFESAKIYDNKIPKWVQNYLAAKSCSIDPAASNILTEYLGNDLAKISNELDKLLITIPEGENRIKAEHIEKNIGISKDYNSFELTKALAKKNVLKANRIINYFGENQKLNNINQTISSLFYFFSKVLAIQFLNSNSNREIAATLQIPPFFVPDYQIAAKNYSKKKTVEIISILRDYDLKSKGYGNPSTPPEELLQEMIFKILH